MAHRRYESDSSTDALEDYPVLRTPRLCGGQGPSGRSGEPSDSPDSDTDANDPTGNAKNDSNQVIDPYEYLKLLCDLSHKRHLTKETYIMPKCRGCGKDRTRPKVQCGQCKVFVHAGCSDDALAPLPCVHPTPIADIKHPNLAECTALLSRRIPRVPAILVKCFYELQREERIRTPNMYAPPSPEELPILESLSAKLRRSVDRKLDCFSTQVVAGCVSKFLSDIREQLLTRDEINGLISLHLSCGDSRDALAEGAEEFVQERVDEPHRLQTLAALLLHLRTVDSYQREKLGESRAYASLEPIFGLAIQSLFVIDPEFWLSIVTSVSNPEDVSARSAGVARFLPCCTAPQQ